MVQSTSVEQKKKRRIFWRETKSRFFFANFFHLWVAGRRFIVVRVLLFSCAIFEVFCGPASPVVAQQKTSKIANEKTRHSAHVNNNKNRKFLTFFFFFTRYFYYYFIFFREFSIFIIVNVGYFWSFLLDKNRRIRQAKNFKNSERKQESRISI